MNFGFVSTRFAGTDGVSLESSKWAEVLEAGGHRVFWFSGLSDRPENRTFVLPEAHFAHPDIVRINESVWGVDRIDPQNSREIARLRGICREGLDDFIARFGIGVIVPENAITIPMNLPLGLAIADLIRETRIPTIAHHHDFYWERERFTGEGVQPYLDEAFPPCLPAIAHAVIHSGAQRDLMRRFGIDAVLVPNVMPFEREAPRAHRSHAEIRGELGLGERDRLILQPTRVVPRKGIEHAIDLLHRLDDPRNHLIVSHAAGDEGLEYRDALLELAAANGVPIQFLDPDAGGDVPSLEELYDCADLVSFPSLFEGFGNALLEAIWFEKPVFVNRYSVFESDIEPLGFELITIDGSVTDDAVASVRAVLDEPESVSEKLIRNRELAACHFGYKTLRLRLGELLAQIDRRI